MASLRQPRQRRPQGPSSFSEPQTQVQAAETDRGISRRHSVIETTGTVPPTSRNSSTSDTPHQHKIGQHRRSSIRTTTTQHRGSPLGPLSSPGFPDSLYHASEFMIGVGMVILQPSTGRVVLVQDTNTGRWFLPKGRKDVGESLEQAALREAYEESGYRAEFLPLYILTNAPSPPALRSQVPTRNTEPIYLSTHQWVRPRWPQAPECNGGEYLTFWFAGQIPEDAVREENTGMPDEVTYVSHLLDLQTAVQRLGGAGFEANIVARTHELWRADAAYEKQVQEMLLMIAQEDAEAELRARNGEAKRNGQPTLSS
ncbi:NUDIX hydrolase domain-like protein [Cytidiella melzeri]|nr:NUDIX hydrolase domain-like protein [Cytidiella melzeri]